MTAEFVARAGELVGPVVVDEVVRHFGADPDRTVAGYLPVRGEIDPGPALSELRTRGWRIVLPVCGTNATMEFCPWNPGDSLAVNAYGIGEPLTRPVAVNEIDAVVVPGVGFGHDGSRIGHGVGYYDRYFARCFAASHDPFRIGLAHDFQIAALPEPQPWDVSMDRVISPTHVITVDETADRSDEGP